MPGRRLRRHIVEFFQGDFSHHGQIVIPRQAHSRSFANEVGAGLWLGAITHGVAKTPERVEIQPVDFGQHSLQSQEIGVDIRKDGNTHNGFWSQVIGMPLQGLYRNC